jgi:hypothetical protein
MVQLAFNVLILQDSLKNNLLLPNHHRQASIQIRISPHLVAIKETVVPNGLVRTATTSPIKGCVICILTLTSEIGISFVIFIVLVVEYYN